MINLSSEIGQIVFCFYIALCLARITLDGHRTQNNTLECLIFLPLTFSKHSANYDRVTNYAVRAY